MGGLSLLSCWSNDVFAHTIIIVLSVNQFFSFMLSQSQKNSLSFFPAIHI